jgi:hypothetical protein
MVNNFKQMMNEGIEDVVLYIDSENNNDMYSLEQYYMYAKSHFTGYTIKIKNSMDFVKG